MTFYHQYQTPLGTMSSRWHGSKLACLRWLGDQDKPAENHGRPSVNNAATSQVAEDFGRQLASYFSGNEVSFSNIEIESSGWTEFMTEVYNRCREIPFGQTMTYKELGCCVGRESASRAVGMAMSRNECLIVVPCHRVVASDGSLRGFSAPGGLQTKQALLELEQSAQPPSLIYQGQTAE